MPFVYFLTKTSGPISFSCTAVGRIDYTKFIQEFGFNPTSIKLNSSRFPKKGLKSEWKWEQIKELFKETSEQKEIMLLSLVRPQFMKYLQICFPCAFSLSLFWFRVVEVDDDGLSVATFIAVG